MTLSVIACPGPTKAVTVARQPRLLGVFLKPGETIYLGISPAGHHQGTSPEQHHSLY